jgi:predicted metal-binding membrane protein
VVVSGIAILLLLSWTYTLWIASEVYGDAHGAFGPHAGRWGLADLAMVVVMWVVMMTAMMVPSVSSTIVMFGEISRKHGGAAHPVASIWVFVVGYLIAWTVFSVGATGAQWGLKEASLMTSVMEVNSPSIGGAILLSAGVFQFTPLKQACLRHCRSPLAFFMSSWRYGSLGALSMGVRHGIYCVGCCWALMAVMFVGGVMNPLWLTGLALFVLAEKLMPSGARFGQVGGIALIAAGAYLIIRF